MELMYNITMMPAWFYLPNRLLQRSHTEYNCSACSNYGDREEKGKGNNIKVNAIYIEKLKKTNQAKEKCFHTYVRLEKVFLPKTTHKIIKTSKFSKQISNRPTVFYILNKKIIAFLRIQTFENEK